MAWNFRKPTDGNGWTISTLHDHLDARLSDMDLRQQQRFDSQTKAVDAAMAAQRAAIDAALIAVDKATIKSEESDRAKFASVNEFRGTLTDQAATFMTRSESLALFERNNERIQEIMRRLDNFVDRETVMTQYNMVMAQVNKTAERQIMSAGKGAGLSSAWVYILGAIAALGTIVSLYLAIK